MNSKLRYTLFLSMIVSLGGFLFGFDAGIISGVMEYAGPHFNLNDGQNGWATSCPTFVAMFAMLISGKLSDIVGRKPILIAVAFLYALSALMSAYAWSFESLYIARMIGGLAFGAALILAPTYIAEISSSENRGKLVTIQQLNIVLGFFAAFLSNYFFNEWLSESEFLTTTNIWRWMLGVELVPALVYFFFLFFVPKSPRWLFSKNRSEEGQRALVRLHGEESAAKESALIKDSLNQERSTQKASIAELLNPSLKFILIVGIVLGVLQQATGINAVYFYANTIFKQTGIGTDASFTFGVLLSFTSVVFTVLAIMTIDRLGRRPLLLIGIAGIAASLLTCAYGFNQATYKLNGPVVSVPVSESNQDKSVALFESKIKAGNEFKERVKTDLGEEFFASNQQQINDYLKLDSVLGSAGATSTFSDADATIQEKLKQLLKEKTSADLEFSKSLEQLLEPEEFAKQTDAISSTLALNGRMAPLFGQEFDSDVAFKNQLKDVLGNQLYGQNEGSIVEAAIDINAILVLCGIIGFIACFAFSLGPCMWVLLSELYPNRIRGLAIGCIGFINSFTAWVVTQIFPWELSHFGNSLTFLIFGLIALVGCVLLFAILPETKGKSLEEIEAELT